MNTANSHDRYTGVWILIPELCIYEQGECPSFGRYAIGQTANEVQISISWRTHNGVSNEVTFGSVNDGRKTASTMPGLSHFSILRISEFMLDSRAYLDEKEIAYARRCVSLDGQLFSTVQVGHRPNGSSFRNFQVYRRDRASDAF